MTEPNQPPQNDWAPSTLDLPTSGEGEQLPSLPTPIRNDALTVKEVKVPGRFAGGELAEVDDLDRATEAITPKEPDRIGRYQSRKLIGEGGFGKVYLAWDPNTKREVAIKIEIRNPGRSPSKCDDLLHEARVAAKFSHPSIVRVLDADIDPIHGAFIVYEYVPKARSLKSFRFGSVMPIDRVARLGATIASAIHVAHKKGFTHRDLKPSNILLTEQGEPKIIDFGLALGDSELLRHEGSASGTVSYMAPEQLEGRTGKIDGRTDVWAIGVILYQMLTGQRPYQSNSPSELRTEIDRKSIKPISQFRDDVPEWLEAAVFKCLRPNPEQRHRSANDLATALTDGLESTQRTSTSSSYRLAGVFLACVIATTAAVAGLDWYLSPRTGLLHATSGLSGDVGQDATDLGNFAAANEAGLFPVLVSTEPAGARVVTWKLDRDTGLLDPESRKEAAERTPCDLELAPGFYLVVTVLDDGRFHEVFRTVPRDPSVTPLGYSHRYWRNVDAKIEWNSISIPELTVTDGMALFPSQHSLAVTSGDVSDLMFKPHFRRVPGFYMAPFEVTFEQYRAISIPDRRHSEVPDLKKYIRFPADRQAVFGVDWDAAAEFAESEGKRLVLEAEHICAATHGGRQRYPWGDERKEEWRFTPIGSDFDVVDGVNGVKVFNLHSNVAEWTGSPASNYSPGRKLDSPNSDAIDWFVVRGAPPCVHSGEFGGLEEHADRVIVHSPQGISSPGIGFRVARSEKPWLSIEDIEVIEK